MSPAPQPGLRLSFCVITSGQRPHLLAAALQSIRNQPIDSPEIVVAGRAGPVPGVTVLTCEGAARAGRLGCLRNLAVRASTGDLVVVLDDDIVLGNGWYSALQSAAEPWDILTSRVLLPDGTRYWDHAMETAQGCRSLLETADDHPHALAVGGAAWVMSRAVAEAVSWDDSIGMYQGEDSLFSQHCRDAGFRIRHCPRMVACHVAPCCTQVGRAVLQRGERRSFAWVRQVLADATDEELLARALWHADRGETAEVADVVRLGLERSPDDERFQRIWQALTKGEMANESLTQWKSEGDAALRHLLEDLGVCSAQALFDEALETTCRMRSSVPGHSASTFISVCNAGAQRGEELGEVLMEGVELAGASLEKTHAERAHFAWTAPIFNPSGYSDEAREFILALDRAGFEVAVESIPWRDRPVVLPANQERRLLSLAARAPRPGCIHVDHFFRPDLRPRADARLNVWRTMFETDRVPEGWVEAAKYVDQIWVPSEFNRETFASSGIPESKLRVLPPPYDFARFNPNVPPLRIDGARRFNFLSLFDWTLRKGWDLLLRAYVSEFQPDEDVALIIKTHSSLNRSTEEIAEEIRCYVERELARSISHIPDIILQDANLPHQRLPNLYAAADCFVLPTRGEGWGRPCMEAMAMGLPVIATGWSGHTAFMTEENSLLLPFEMVEVPEQAWRETPTYRGHRWAEPCVAALRNHMRWVTIHPEEAHAKGARARQEVLATYSREAFLARICRILGEEPPVGCTVQTAQESLGTSGPLWPQPRQEVPESDPGGEKRCA